MYRCPKCESDELEVIVMCWAKLTQSDDGREIVGSDTSESLDGSHDWDGNSLMRCQDCMHSAPAASFETDDGDEDDEDELCECGREKGDCASSHGADYCCDVDDYERADCPDEFEEMCRRVRPDLLTETEDDTENELKGKRFRSLIRDMEEDDDYGEVIHPVGSEFIVGDPMGDQDGSFAVLWQGTAKDKDGKDVPADGMWTIWTPEEIAKNAEEVSHT